MTSLTVWLLLCSALGMAWCLTGWSRRWLKSAPRPSAADVEAITSALLWASPGYVPIDLPPSLRLLPDDELCRRWRASCEQLDEPTSSVPGPEVVRERQELLDEIERRNPAGFSAWLASPAPTAASLALHLSRVPTGEGSLDWDVLLEREE